MLYDSHCHLDMLPEAERSAALARAREAGVRAILNPSASAERFELVLSMTQFPDVYAAIGVHPEEDGTGIDASVLLDWVRRGERVIAIGECGLDYHSAGYDVAAQERLFVEHIIAARESGLPIIIHARDADKDLVRILAREMARGEFRFVMHCFASSPWLAEATLEMGAYISASGIITFGSAEEIRGVFMRAPIDRVLVETDAPFLAPVPHRGKQNEPAYVSLVARKLAEIRGVSYEEIIAATGANFEKLFVL
jgi:TatD DNase family protein